MLSTQDIGVEITVVLSRDGVRIGLSTDLDTVRLMCLQKESALRGHKYRARKVASIAVVVAAIVVVGAEKSGVGSH
jgi:hypothetical protein